MKLANTMPNVGANAPSTATSLFAVNTSPSGLHYTLRSTGAYTNEDYIGANGNPVPFVPGTTFTAQNGETYKLFAQLPGPVANDLLRIQ